VRDVCNMMAASKNFYEHARNDFLWKAMYFDRWKDVLRIPNVSDLVDGDDPECACLREEWEKLKLVNWYRCFASRATIGGKYMYDTQVLDIGGHTIKACSLFTGEIRSAVSAEAGNLSYASHPHYMILGHHFDVVFGITEGKATQSIEEIGEITYVIRNGSLSATNALHATLNSITDDAFTFGQSVLAISPFPRTFENRRGNRYFLEEASKMSSYPHLVVYYGRTMHAPYTIMPINSAVLVALAHGLNTALVVSLGADQSWICGVENGKEMKDPIAFPITGADIDEEIFKVRESTLLSLTFFLELVSFEIHSKNVC